MARYVVSRTQRRSEKKQALMIGALVLAVSLLSFVLGVFVGRGSVSPPVPPVGDVVQEVIIPDPPGVNTAVVQAPAVDAPPVAPPSTEPLTFFETLPKGEPTPMGSGINLPPGQKAEPKVAETPPAPPAAKSVVKNSSASSPSVDFHILQVASFVSFEDARKLMVRLHSKGFPASIEAADLGSKGVWHRVLVGPYPSRSEAESAASRLKSEAKLSALVRRQ